MRFMLNAFADRDAEAGAQLDPRLISEIGKLIDELTKSGVLLAMGGLAPTAKGARLKLADGRVTVTDGPFMEVKEVLGGAWFVEVSSKEEAIEIAKRVWKIMADVFGPSYQGEGEVRELASWVNLEASNRV